MLLFEVIDFVLYGLSFLLIELVIALDVFFILIFNCRIASVIPSSYKQVNQSLFGNLFFIKWELGRLARNFFNVEN